MTAHIDDIHNPRRLDKLSPHDIEKRLGRLIRHYLRTRSPAIASLVVHHIETLCAHPGFAGGMGDRCVYLRLRAQWRWLANVEPARQGA